MVYSVCTMNLFPDHIDPVEQIPTDGIYARVAIERGIDRMGGLTYLANDEVQVGQRIEVPVGRGNTPTGGIVIETGGIELLDGFDPRKVKAILGMTNTVLPTPLIELGQWMSTYYMCPLGMVFGSILPAAVKAQTGRRVRKMVQLSGMEVDAQLLKSLTPKARDAWSKIEDLDHSCFPIDARLLSANIDHKSVAAINKLIDAGFLERIDVETITAPKAFKLLDAGDSGTHILTADQSKVVDGIVKTLSLIHI